MGYDEPWLHDEPEEVLREILDASRPKNPTLDGITLERLQAEGTVAYTFPDDDSVPFADGRFPTPSGKVELRCEAIAALGLDPVPDYQPPAEFVTGLAPDEAGQPPLVLITGAAHHFVTTSMANQPGLVAKEGTPFIEINPEDAPARQDRSWSGRHRLERARLVHAARRRHRRRAPRRSRLPKGRWASLSEDRRNVNWLTPDAIADLAGQSTYHSNLVHVRPATAGDPQTAHERMLTTVAD